MRTYRLHYKLALVSLALSALTGTGCGNWVRAGVERKAAESTYKDSGGSAYTAQGPYPEDKGYTCPSSYQISNPGGADKYLVCPADKNAFGVSLHGTPSQGQSQICVFPVDVLDASRAYAAADNNGQVISKCVDASSQTVHMEFTGARFNAVFVVHAPNAQAMSWCLTHGNYDACPAYSYQRFGPYDTAFGQ